MLMLENKKSLLMLYIYIFFTLANYYTLIVNKQKTIYLYA